MQGAANCVSQGEHTIQVRRGLVSLPSLPQRFASEL